MSKEQKIYIDIIHEISRINKFSSYSNELDSICVIKAKGTRNYMCIQKDNSILSELKDFTKKAKQNTLFFFDKKTLFFCHIKLFLIINKYEIINSNTIRIDFSFVDLDKESLEERIKTRQECVFIRDKKQWKLKGE